MRTTTITLRLRTGRAPLLVAFCAVGVTLPAQQQIVPGNNVNMVSGRTLPGGDPYLQRQNEPSVAASTRNPLHLLAGGSGESRRLNRGADDVHDAEVIEVQPGHFRRFIRTSPVGPETKEQIMTKLKTLTATLAATRCGRWCRWRWRQLFRQPVQPIAKRGCIWNRDREHVSGQGRSWSRSLRLAYSLGR